MRRWYNHLHTMLKDQFLFKNWIMTKLCKFTNFYFLLKLKIEKKNQINEFLSGFVKRFIEQKMVFCHIVILLDVGIIIDATNIIHLASFFHAFYAAPGFGRTIGSTNFMTHGIFKLFQHDCIHCFCLFIRLPYRPGIDNYYAKKIGYLLI